MGAEREPWFVGLRTMLSHLWRRSHRTPSRSGRFTAKGLPAALSQPDLNALALIHHPYIVGLFAELPEPDTKFPDRDVWLRVARLILSQVYETRPVGLTGSSVQAEASGVGNESDTRAANSQARPS